MGRAEKRVRIAEPAAEKAPDASAQPPDASERLGRPLDGDRHLLEKRGDPSSGRQSGGKQGCPEEDVEDEARPADGVDGHQVEDQPHDGALKTRPAHELTCLLAGQRFHVHKNSAAAPSARLRSSRAALRR